MSRSMPIPPQYGYAARWKRASASACGPQPRNFVSSSPRKRGPSFCKCMDPRFRGGDSFRAPLVDLDSRLADEAAVALVIGAVHLAELAHAERAGLAAEAGEPRTYV